MMLIVYPSKETFLEHAVQQMNAIKEKGETIDRTFFLFSMCKINIHWLKDDPLLVNSICQKLVEHKPYFDQDSITEEYEDCYKTFQSVLQCHSHLLKFHQSLKDLQISVNMKNPTPKKEMPKKPAVVVEKKKLTPPSKGSGKLIGEGSFGSVYELSKDQLIKKVKKNPDNFVEIMWLKSFVPSDSTHPFLPRIHHVEIRNETIEITMDHCGLALDDFAKKRTFMERIEMIPSLMCQLARFLVWMEDHQMVHMDIKNNNICIQSGKLYFIDWGFVNPACLHSAKYVGTHAFADPKYLEEEHAARGPYDMFSSGMVLLSFLTKKYLPHIKGFEIEMEEIMKYSYIIKTLTENLNQDVANLLTAMLDQDEQTRICPRDLYNHSCLVKYHETYPLIPKQTDGQQIMHWPWSNNMSYDPIQPVNAKMRNVLVEWLVEVCQTIQYEHLFHHAVRLVYQVTNVLKIKRTEFQGYGVMCLYLVHLIFYSQANDTLSLEIMSQLCKKTYNTDKLMQIMINILTALDWKIYPQSILLDWNMPRTELTSWMKQFYTAPDEWVPEVQTKMDAFIESIH
jgi:Protein kinase domain/Cyclin, N-terminal domain